MARGLTEEDLDAQFEQFLKESVSDDSIHLGHDDDQRQAISSGESSQNQNSLRGEENKIRSGRRELAPISAANVTGIGLDTMEEEEEKNRFFAQLEAGASSTVDYSQLNRQWDSSSFTITADLSRAEQTPVNHRATDVVRPLQDSLHPSQDFENRSDVKEPLEEEEKEDLFEVKELRAQLALKEEELQRMRKEAEELTSVRQKNYVLQSKLQSAKNASQKKSWKDEGANPADKIQQAEKDFKEQEMLIKGFQQENEKLYFQLKTLQATSKANEEAMFEANQRLQNQLALTRDQLKKTSWPVGSVLPGTSSGDLLAQIGALQKSEAKLSEDLHRLKQEKLALEVDLQLMKKERDVAKAQIVSTKEDEPNEEVVALRKRLQSFAENQRTWERTADRLKTASTEIDQLKERVKQLEQTLRSKNPKFVPAAIHARVSSAHHQPADSTRKSMSSCVNALLERRVQHLEAELEGQNEEAKQSLCALQQQFHLIKGRLEQQISELEQQLEQKPQEKSGDPRMADCRALEEELNRVKESHQEKEKSLLQEIETLQQQLKTKAQPGPGRHQRQAEAAFGFRIERLNQELAAKTRSIQELNRTVKKLQRERRNMLSVPESRSTETKQQCSCHQTHHSAPAEDHSAEVEAFLPAQSEKTYQPAAFTGSHINEVLQENKDLKQCIELLQLHSEHEKAALKADAVQAKEELVRLEEHFREQLASMKTEHLRELDHMRASHALEHSSSKVTELTNKLSTHQTDMKHLQARLKELQETKEALALSRSREDALQMQVARLLQELKKAKEAEGPGAKLLSNLEKKILQVELRHQLREEELQQFTRGAGQTSADLRTEDKRWKSLVLNKNKELETFRLELDTILDILRHLQRQGMTPTLSNPNGSAS
ncbi:centrosomal protein of 162 kDa isoform X1 [Oryzias latipes]|uniref:Centrosomal protein of 162 kDa n=1 Tax=Oryzias latipes TaxID=8090 RepID=H2LGQ5_ORYLA|nr:centrosomal protein of 162 kDa isoform X1 [Oryzias latipes]